MNSRTCDLKLTYLPILLLELKRYIVLAWLGMRERERLWAHIGNFAKSSYHKHICIVFRWHVIYIYTHNADLCVYILHITITCLWFNSSVGNTLTSHAQAYRFESGKKIILLDWPCLGLSWTWPFLSSKLLWAWRYGKESRTDICIYFTIVKTAAPLPIWALRIQCKWLLSVNAFWGKEKLYHLFEKCILCIYIYIYVTEMIRTSPPGFVPGSPTRKSNILTTRPKRHLFDLGEILDFWGFKAGAATLSVT